MPDTRSEDLLNVDRAFQVAWIVYVNGIEVPTVGATVHYGVWVIPEAEIQLIPDTALQRLGAEDRVSVQIFYCDYWITPDNPQFRLMFDGEIVSWSYINTSRGRSLSFSCVDYIQIWTQLFFFFMSTINDMATGASGSQIGTNISSVLGTGFAPTYPYSLFAQGIVPHPVGDTDGSADQAPGSSSLITRPVDFIYNIVRSLIDNAVPNRTTPAANFFSPWTQKTNFHKRFIALPYLEDSNSPGVFPVLRAVQANYALDAVAQMASRVGTAGSIWQMLQEIMQTLVMEIAMLPTPPAVGSNYQTLEVMGAAPTTSTAENPVFLGNYFIKPPFFFGLPPTCNVFFPSQIVNYAYEENFITQPTRMYFNDETLPGYLQVDANAGPGLSAIMRDALAVAHPEEVNRAMLNTRTDPSAHGKDILVYPEEFFKGPVVDRRALPTWFQFLGQARDQTPGAGDTTVTPVETEEGAGTTDNRGDVFRKYAAYEFFKEKYSRRTGSLELVFNPYPVPGFPCAVFDRRSTQVDTFGYVMSVRQTLRSSGWSTQLAYTHGRTFQEMFALLRKQFDFDTEIIAGQNAASAATQEVDARETAVTSTASPTDQLVGALATAPPDPLIEIRDIVHNFDRAEAFYRSLFFSSAAPASTSISIAQAEGIADRATVLSPVAPVVELAKSRERLTNASLTGATQEQTVVPPAAQQPTLTSPSLGISSSNVPSILQTAKRAVFYYPEIINLTNTATGQSESIVIQGVDATARNEALAALARARAGDVSQAALDTVLISRVAGISNVPQRESPNSENVYSLIETLIRTRQTLSNVDGTSAITPKPEAVGLFQSYEYAMRYSARPICTLDEYIAFLGDQGRRTGLIEPNGATALNDPRTFPAPYYVAIRQYREGPPPTVPATNIANSPIVSGPDGVSTKPVAVVPEESDTPETSTHVESIPEDFPQTISPWSTLLLAYRQRALTSLPPRT